MIKLRNFWIALAMGCAFSVGTTSCEEDEEEPVQTNITEAKEDGDAIKDVVNNYTENGGNLLDQATSMTKAELQSLAETLVDYSKNKDNAEWVEAFKQAASQNAAGQAAAVELLDQAISQLENLGVDMKEVTATDLIETFSSIFQGSDQLGDGKEAGMAQGATHQELFDAIYEEKLAEIPATTEGLTQMISVYQGLDADQQKELVNIALAWSNKSDDEAWQEGFLAGVGVKDEAAQKDLKAKLDLLAQYKSFIAAGA